MIIASGEHTYPNGEKIRITVFQPEPLAEGRLEMRFKSYDKDGKVTFDKTIDTVLEAFGNDVDKVSEALARGAGNPTCPVCGKVMYPTFLIERDRAYDWECGDSHSPSLFSDGDLKEIAEVGLKAWYSNTYPDHRLGE